MNYDQIRPDWCKIGSERDVEICFLLTMLHKLFPDKDERISLLDVGFAGSGYIENILDLGNVNYFGLDKDPERIQGDALRLSEKSDGKRKEYDKERWKKVLSRIQFIEADILDFSSEMQYDVVISISTIEHIVPSELSFTDTLNVNRDLQAVQNMKKLVKGDGYLLLTFPCGKECLLYPEDIAFKLKGSSLEKRFVKHRQSILICDEDRIKKFIGDWTILEQQFWISRNEKFQACKKNVACSIAYTTSDLIKSICALLLKKKEN